MGSIRNSDNHRLRVRVRIDLIEADVNMAFGLVDDAREEFHEGNQLYAQRALEDAGQALADLGSRLQELEPERSAPFGPLVDELRKAINEAQTECA